MSRTVLLTGATGFLGMEVLARLLERGDVEVLALVRGADAEEAQTRLDGVLSTLYDAPTAEVAERARAVAGDATAEGLGLSDADSHEVVGRVDGVLHCAASIAFDLPLEQARDINTQGTRRVLELAREMDSLRRFVHVSTAYVSGDHAGPFREADLDVGQGFRNTYEQSKYETEMLLAEHDGEVPLAIARPSIVVGESATGWTPTFNVIYWPLQAFARGLFTEVAADPDGIIDMVPVDYVAEVMERALFEPGIDGAFHAVAGERALTVAEVIEQTCRVFDRDPPKLTPIGTLPDDHPATVFAPYFDVHTVFGDERARSLVSNGGPPPAESYMPGLLDYGVQTRWGKAPLSREAARARSATSASRG